MNRCPGNLLTTYLSRGCSFGYIPFLLNNTNNTMSPYKFRVYAKTNDNGGYLETYQEGESGIHFYYDGGLRGISYLLTYSNIARGSVANPAKSIYASKPNNPNPSAANNGE